jgi:streptomycin 6-kinase
VAAALARAWEASGRLCAKRPVRFPPEVLPLLERHGGLALEAPTRARLLALSSATADRLLRPTGARLLRPPAAAALRALVPVRTWGEWAGAAPGAASRCSPVSPRPPRAGTRTPGGANAATAYVRELAPTQREPVLINEDLHGDNVLRAKREPWLVIDPAPLIGEREFTLATIIRCPEFGHTEAQVCLRLDRLTADLGLDRERARGWAVAHAVARSFLGRPVRPHCVEVARWLLRAPG